MNALLRRRVTDPVAALPLCAAELMKVGAVLSVSNARINMFQGTPRLAGVYSIEEDGDVEPQARGSVCV